MELQLKIWRQITLHCQLLKRQLNQPKNQYNKRPYKNQLSNKHLLMSNTNYIETRLMSLQSNMLNFAYSLTNNRDDAYDLVQDTVLKVLGNQEKYTENTNFKGWVFTIMRNIFINNYRRAVRSATIIDQTENLHHLNLSQDSGFDTPEGSYTVNEITEAISEFPEKYRQPFSMHVAGYKYEEIAEEMGLPLGTIKSRIFAARQTLQKRFADYL